MKNINGLGIFDRASLIALVAIGLLSGWIGAYAMHWGPLAYSDSVSYLEMAHNLLAGRGPVEIKGSGRIELLAAHPPFYSVILAAMSLTGQPLISSARVLNIVLFALFIFGVGFCLYLLTRRGLLSIAVSLFILSAHSMAINFTGAMSEPTFFFLGFLGLFLALFNIRTKQAGFLWASAVLNGLAFVSRFTGAILIGTGIAVILLFSAKPFKRRALDGLIYAALGLIPFAVYRIYLQSIGAGMGFYGVPSYPELETFLRSGFRTITQLVIGWLPWGSTLGARFPRYHGTFLVVLGLGAAALIALVLIKQGKNALRSAWGKPNFQIGVTFGLFSLVYLAFLMATFIFVQNPKPILDERILSPVLVGAVLCFAGLTDYFLEPSLAPIVSQLIQAAVILVFIASNLSPTISYIQQIHASGIGYTSQAWQESGTIHAVEALPDSLHIISDNIDAIKFFTFRSASRIPELDSKTPQPIDQAFGDDPNDVVQAQFRAGQAVLVLFNQSYQQFDAIYGGQNTRIRMKAFTRSLYPYYQGPDGAIYTYSAPK